MTQTASNLRRELQQAGIANAAIDAAWPQWWSTEAESSLSATAELTYTVARRLGLSPSALWEGQTSFLWTDETKFKSLKATQATDESIIAAYGSAVGRTLLQFHEGPGLEPRSAQDLRQLILASGQFVEASSLVTAAWALEIPVIQLRVFPLEAKRMHAMSVHVGGRFAILLAKAHTVMAGTAFAIAHELGHIMLGHLQNSAVLLDEHGPGDRDTTEEKPEDHEEFTADRYARELLTGRPDLEVESDAQRYSATQLAHAAKNASTDVYIDPGVLAYCLAIGNDNWLSTMGALKIIPPGTIDVGERVNNIAKSQLKDVLSGDAGEFLSAVTKGWS